jgi:hypothetical protein
MTPAETEARRLMFIEQPIGLTMTEAARSHVVSVNTGANPPPGVRKFVVCP